LRDQSIKLSSITTDGGTQTRCVINEEVVAEYAERMLEGDIFPAVTVFHDGTHYFLADGCHRVLAAQRNGFLDILADVHKGTKTDALKFAIGANRTNGLPRTNADKRRCVVLALESFSDMSDRAVAELCGVSNAFVGTLRAEVLTVNTSKTRKGKDGKKYPARASAPAKTADDKLRKALGGTIPLAPTELCEPGSGTVRLATESELAEAESEARDLRDLKHCWRSATSRGRKDFLKWAKEFSPSLFGTDQGGKA
jgi:uncharacterized ParB-like nuclease family protein